MTPERWQKVEELFHAALELRAEERAAFLNENCAGDQSLIKEIEALLSSDAQEENTIERVASFHVAMSNRPIVPVHPTRPRRDDFLQFVLSRNA